MKKMNTSRKGRKCKVHGCKKVLSIYNHDNHCHVHADHKPSFASSAKASKR